MLYRGTDLNAYLDRCVIEPTCRRDGPAALPGPSGAGSAVDQGGVSAAA